MHPAEDLALDEEGVCYTTSFPLLLFLKVVSYWEGSSSVVSISVDPVAKPWCLGKVIENIALFVPPSTLH